MLSLFAIAVFGPDRSPEQRPARDDGRELLRAMAGGDAGAPFEAFYDRYAPAVLALATRVLGSQAEAEELLQEIFVELWRRAGQYDERRARVSTWVMTIARSRAIDALRARQRRGGASDVDDAQVTLPAPAADRPDELAERRARSQRVRRALAELSDDKRRALELAYFGGLSHSEIAAAEGLPLGTVKSRIIGAMRHLRQVLGDGGQP